MTDEFAAVLSRLRGMPDPLALLGALFSHAPVGFQVWDAAGHSVLTNGAFRALFGAEPPPEYNCFRDELIEAQQLGGELRRAFSGETVHVGPLWYDARALQHVTPAEGRRIAIECTLFPLLSEQGKVSYVAAAYKDVTAELSLRASEENLTITLRSIGDGVIATDVEGRVRRMNPVAEALTGVPMGEAEGRPLSEVFQIVNEATRKPVVSPVSEVLRTGNVVGLANHTVLIARDGTERPIADSGAPIRDAQGAMHGVVLVFRDQSEERAAQRAEERLHMMVTNAPVAFFATDAEGRYTAVEGQRVRTLGMRASDLIGQSALELTENDPAVNGALRRGLAGEALTFRGESRTGGKFECRLVPERNADGTLRGMTGISYDVTEQDRAERALRQNEEHLRLALEAGRLVTMEVNFEADTCSMSSNALEVLGASLSQLRKFSRALELVHPDDLPVVHRTMAQARQQGGQPPDAQYRIIRPDNGETVWLERRVRFVRDARGQIVGARGLLGDISERKRSEEIQRRHAELQQQNSRVEEASRLKSEFLANMSHELRTPLNAIIGFAELLHDGAVDPDSPRHQEFLADILAGGRHLLRLINDVLDLAKVEAGRQDFWPEPVELPQLVEEVASLLRTTVATKRIKLITEIDASLTDIVIDPARFKQVLFNYLSNALKFSREGDRVLVRALPDGPENFRLEVEDHGIGIAPADVGRLFRDFRQLEAGANKRHQGTGLGLVLTRKLVEAQGGSVGLRSKLGEGSTFSVTLPRRLRQQVGMRTPLVSRGSHAPGSVVVLVVEDEPRDRQLLTSTLRRAGFEVDAVSHGAEALELCQQRRYDAITLDLLLPDMSGLELLSAVRTSTLNRAAPVVVVTVIADQSVLSNFEVHGVLAKPLDPAQLLGSLRDAGLVAEAR